MRTVIDKINVEYLGQIVRIEEVVYNNTKSLRYYIRGFGMNGKYGRKNFDKLWKNFLLWLQIKKLDAQKNRHKIKNWIEGWVSFGKNKKIKDNQLIFLVNRKLMLNYI